MRKYINFIFLILTTFALNLYATYTYFYGYISWYGKEFSGKKTSSGLIYKPEEYFCAHRTLPFGTIVEIMNLRNGERCEAMVVDRGPFNYTRVLDVSEQIAKELNFKNEGITYAKIKILLLTNISDPVKLESFYQKYFKNKRQVQEEYAIQVGAFTNAQNAQKVYTELKQKGYQVYTATININNITFTRVRVGDFPTQETTEKILKNLQKDYPEAILIKISQQK